VRRSEEPLRRGNEYLKERAADLEHAAGKLPETRVATADPVAAIQSLAEEHGERTLLAVGRPGLHAAERFVLGNVSATVLRTLSGPVLIVPPTEESRR
jgi:nucleotide-binding universal stress UspA family protein